MKHFNDMELKDKIGGLGKEFMASKAVNHFFNRSNYDDRLAGKSREEALEFLALDLASKIPGDAIDPSYSVQEAIKHDVILSLKMLPGCEDLRPQYAHPGEDAGMDIKCREDFTILPGEVKIIPTGIYQSLPFGFEMQVRSRSGMVAKNLVNVANSPGTVDAGYRGEVGVITQNIGTCSQSFKRGERIAQIVIARVCYAKVEYVNELPASKRGVGGFGSTGLRASLGD